MSWRAHLCALSAAQMRDPVDLDHPITAFIGGVLRAPSIVARHPVPITRNAAASCFDQRVEQPISGAVFGHRQKVFIHAGGNVCASVPASARELGLEVLARACRTSATREEYPRTLREPGARGVIVLSGDRHIGALYRHEAGLARPLIELTASPATRPFPGNREPGPNRIGAVYGMENFGTVDIDWWARQVSLSVRGMNGEPVRRVELGFGVLGVAP